MLSKRHTERRTAKRRQTKNQKNGGRGGCVGGGGGSMQEISVQLRTADFGVLAKCCLETAFSHSLLSGERSRV